MVKRGQPLFKSLLTKRKHDYWYTINSINLRRTDVKRDSLGK